MGEGKSVAYSRIPSTKDKCQGSTAVEKSSQIADKLQGIEIISIWWRNQTRS